MRRAGRLATGTVVTLVAVLGVGGATYALLGRSGGTAPGSEERQVAATSAPTVAGTAATRSPSTRSPSAPSGSPSAAGTPTTTAPPSPAPARGKPKPKPKPVLSPGDRGVRVRELQGRLTQLAWYVPPMSGSYDRATRTAVSGFQAKRGFEPTGVVEPRTWRRLVTMTRTPTSDEMFNRSGPALLEGGDRGAEVRVLQARLRQVDWFAGDVSDVYGPRTTAAVRGFQAKRRIPLTGDVDRRTLDLLTAMTSAPSADELANRRPEPATTGSVLDARCTTGRALCIDKTTTSLRWVVDGQVRSRLDVRFGSEYTPTREGLFSVYWKDRDHVSSLFGSAMPLSMFFSKGQAVHFSSDFAARGYAGASHGCVNVRDYAGLAALFDEVRTGDKLVVYRS